MIAIVRSRRWSSRARTWASNRAPPSDAVVLFDGKDLSQWEGGDPKGIEDGCINIRQDGRNPNEDALSAIASFTSNGPRPKSRRTP